MKKKGPIFLLVLSMLTVVLTFFFMYMDNVSTKQEKIAAENKKKQELVNKKKVVKKTYEEETNEKIASGSFSNRMKIPLILQTDKRWKKEYYGVEDGDPIQNTLEINGCAIVSLAMVSSYLEQTERTPLEVLKWSGNRFFSKDQGTSWSIFSEFAAENKYQFADLEDNIELAKEHLKKGHPIIISVKPGYFTEIGHIMVLSGYNEVNNTFWLNNPSDTKKKGHSIKEFSQEDLQKEAIRYWAIYK